MSISSTLWSGIGLFLASLMSSLYLRVRENRLRRERLCEACETLHSLDEDFSVNGRRMHDVVMPLTPVRSAYEIAGLVYHHVHESGPCWVVLSMNLGVFMMGYGVRDSLECG